MVLLLNDALARSGKGTAGEKQKQQDEEALVKARDARMEQTRASFEAMERGRHPRSFPNNGGVWSLVKMSRKRVNAMQNGASLHRVLGVDESSAREIRESHVSRREEDEERQQSRGSGGSGGMNGAASGGVGRGSGNKKLSPFSSVARATIRLRAVKEGGAAGGRKVGDSVALAKSYLDNYEPGQVRAQKAARRMSKYRHVANSNAGGLHSIGRRAVGLGLHKPPGRAAATPKAAGKGDKVVDAITFLAKARQKGHHRDNDSVLRYIEHCHLQEQAKKAADGAGGGTTGAGAAAGGKPGKPATGAARSFKSAGDEAMPPGGASEGAGAPAPALSFQDLRLNNSGPDADVEYIEFLPPNTEANLFFGSQVALEYHDGSFLTVSDPNGSVSLMQHPRSTNEGAGELSFSSTCPLDPVAVSSSSSILFTLLNLNDPEYVGPICSDDDVWLCIHPGQGQFSWKDGSILGSRVTGGADIGTVPIDKTGRIKTYSQEKEDLQRIRSAAALPSIAAVTTQPPGLATTPSADDGSQTLTPAEPDLLHDGKNGEEITDTASPNGAGYPGQSSGDDDPGRSTSAPAQQHSPAQVPPNVNTASNSSRDSSSSSSNSSGASGSDRTGSLLPILAYVPKLPGQGNLEKSLDDLYRDATNIQRVQKLNRTATHLGQWKIRAASNAQIKEFVTKQKHSTELSGGSELSSASGPAGGRSIPIANSMAISLEQDWVFIAADDQVESSSSGPDGTVTLGGDGHAGGGVGQSGGGTPGGGASGAAAVEAAALSSGVPVPRAGLDTVLKKMRRDHAAPPRAQYRVERQAVFHIRIVQPKLQSVSSNAKSVEQTLLRARVQLKQSEETRRGERKQYQRGLASGTKFTSQIRKVRHDLQNKASTRFLEPVEHLEQRKGTYFFERYQSLVAANGISAADVMRRGPVVEVPAAKKSNLVLQSHASDSQQQTQQQTQQHQQQHQQEQAARDSGGGDEALPGTSEAAADGAGGPRLVKSGSQHSVGALKRSAGKNVFPGGLPRSRRDKYRWGTLQKKASPGASRIARNFVKSLDITRQEQEKARRSEEYQKRMAGEPVTPWFETVFQLREVGDEIMAELYPCAALTAAEAHATPVEKVRAAAKKLMFSKRAPRSAERKRELRQRKIDKAMKSQLYQLFVKEDERIAIFQARQQLNQELRANGEMDQ